jgi:uncharacterized protein YndB with AHSA1/START domain
MAMANSPGLTITTPSDLEIEMTRAFRAPRRLVFDAWTKPELLPRWFGAQGWTVPVCEIDLRPGGNYRYVMEGPDRAVMVLRGVYHEIVRPARLVATETYDGWPEHQEAVVTSTFTERDGITLWKATVRYPSRELRDAILRTGMERGLGESMDRLTNLLEAMIQEENATVSERAAALAAKFEQANADAIETVERLSEAQWQLLTGEGWTVAATAHHAAIVHDGIAGFVREVANGTATPRTGMDAIDESNAKHAQEFAACDKSEVLETLHARGAAAAAIVRGLTDEQLDRQTDAIPGAPPMSAAQIIEIALIGHIAEHTRSIKQAIEAVAPSASAER